MTATLQERYDLHVTLQLRVFDRYDVLGLACGNCGAMMSTANHALLVYNPETNQARIVCKRGCGRATAGEYPRSVELVSLLARMLPRNGGAR